MWKAERFSGSDEKDPLEQLVEFVNARHLEPGQFHFSVASDEEGYQYCLLVYTEQKPAVPPPPRQAAPRPSSRFGGPPATGKRPERREFKPQFGPPSEGKFGRGRGRPGGPPGGGTRGGQGRPPKRGR